MTSDRGSGSVCVLAAAAVVLLAGIAAAAVGSAAVARHRADAAADFAALAAAATAVHGGAAACSAADRIARANGARVVACRVSGLDAVVSVGVAATGLARSFGEAHVSARAGPAPP